MAQLIKIGIPRSQWNSDHTKKWVSNFCVGKKRIHRALSPFKPEAKRLLKEMLEVRRAQKHGDIVRGMSWGHFRDTYLRESHAGVENGTRDIKTYDHDHRTFELVDAMTSLQKIEQMTPDRLAGVKVALIEKRSYTKSCIARGIRGMITAMRWAEDRKYVAMQNWRIVQKKNREPAGRKDYYHREDFLTLLSKLEVQWFTSALLMGRAGLRLGEALFLEWNDINLEARSIVFRSKPHLGWKIKKDDDLKKVRTIPMLTADLRQHLEAIRKPTGFVLELPGKRREDVYGRQLTRALKATGITTASGRFGHPHILRHTFGSHLAQIGISLKKIAEWMGHESIRMTEGYSHLCPTDTTNDINAVEKLCFTFGSSKSSDQSPRALLGTLSPDLVHASLSSETNENT